MKISDWIFLSGLAYLISNQASFLVGMVLMTTGYSSDQLLLYSQSQIAISSILGLAAIGVRLIEISAARK